jgi:hypothetical protein
MMGVCSRMQSCQSNLRSALNYEMFGFSNEGSILDLHSLLHLLSLRTLFLYSSRLYIYICTVWPRWSRMAWRSGLLPAWWRQRPHSFTAPTQSSETSWYWWCAWGQRAPVLWGIRLGRSATTKGRICSSPTEWGRYELFWQWVSRRSVAIYSHVNNWNALFVFGCEFLMCVCSFNLFQPLDNCIYVSETLQCYNRR